MKGKNKKLAKILVECGTMPPMVLSLLSVNRLKWIIEIHKHKKVKDILNTFSIFNICRYFTQRPQRIWSDSSNFRMNQRLNVSTKTFIQI